MPSYDEGQIIRRFVFQWLTCGGANRPSGRRWARALGVSHTWVQKLVRRFQADPCEMEREVQQCGHPTFAQLWRARERSEEMRDRSELRRHAQECVNSGRNAILTSLPAGEMDSEYRQAILRTAHAEQRTRNFVDERNLVHKFEYDY